MGTLDFAIALTKSGFVRLCVLRFFHMPTDADFASLIESEMEQRGILGLNLLVCKHGEVLEQRSYGVANLEHNVLVTPETVFQIGSIGKQFVATAIMLLVEQGKIDLEAGPRQTVKNRHSRCMS